MSFKKTNSRLNKTSFSLTHDRGFRRGKRGREAGKRQEEVAWRERTSGFQKIPLLFMSRQEKMKYDENDKIFRQTLQNPVKRIERPTNVPDNLMSKGYFF